MIRDALPLYLVESSSDSPAELVFNMQPHVPTHNIDWAVEF